MKLLLRVIPILFFISFLPISMSCSQSKDASSDKQTGSSPQKKCERLAQEKFNGNYVLEFNSAGSYVLCFQKEDSIKDQSPATSSAYFIYDLNKDLIVHEETIGNGRVQWLNDHQLEVSIIPGIVKGDEKNESNKLNYIYDLELKKKVFNRIDKDK